MDNYKVYNRLFDAIRCRNDIGNKYHNFMYGKYYV